MVARPQSSMIFLLVGAMLSFALIQMCSVNPRHPTLEASNGCPCEMNKAQKEGSALTETRSATSQPPVQQQPPSVAAHSVVSPPSFSAEQALPPGSSIDVSVAQPEVLQVKPEQVPATAPAVPVAPAPVIQPAPAPAVLVAPAPVIQPAPAPVERQAAADQGSLQKVSRSYQSPPVTITSPGTGKRAIFCATAGHTGTHLLTELLHVFPDTVSEHEPEPRMLLSKYHGALPETREAREKEKLGHILGVMKKASNKRVYAEMSNMFVKTFWDLDWFSHFDTVHVIVLRRWGPSVVKAHVNRGLGDEKFRTTTSWPDYTETMGLRDAAIPWPAAAEKTSMTRMTYYVLDIEERIIRLEKQLAEKVKFVEVVYEDLVKAEPEYLRWLFTEIGYTVTDQHVAGLKGKIGSKPAATKRIPAPVDEQTCLANMIRYLALYEPNVDQRGLQALLRHRTASPDFKLVAVAQVWQASEYIAEWLRLVLQFSDAVVLVDDKSEDSTVRIAEASSSSVTVLQKDQWSFDESTAQVRGVEEAVRQGATHIIALDTDEIITANLAKYTRAMVASLPPSTYIDLYLWHPWNGVSEVVDTAPGWTTVQNTPMAYRIADDFTAAWSRKGMHHIGRLPGSIKTAFIALGKTVGGLLHFKYANHDAYNVKIDWYKMMEWRELSAGKGRKEPRNATPAALRKFYATKWPTNVVKKKIPQNWVEGINLEPFRVQQVTRRAREKQMAAWRGEFNPKVLEELLGPARVAVVNKLPVQ